MRVVMLEKGIAEKAQQGFWCVGAGVALTCAFPGIGAHWCAWFALALLMIGLRNAAPGRAFMLGLLAGFVHFLTLLYWLVPTMHRYGPMPVILSLGALLLLAFYLALYMAAFSGLLAGCAGGRFSHPLWYLLLVPVFWVSFEYLREQLFSGFPWGLLGYSQYERLHLIQIADIWGVYGVSFLIAAVNAALFVLIMAAGKGGWQKRTPSGFQALVAGSVAIVLVGGAWGYGAWRMEEVEKTAAASETLDVAVIQGNIEQSLKWDDAFCESTTRKYIRLTGRAMKDSPDLVVWPETALPFYFFNDRELTRKVLDAVDQADTYFLIGSPAYEKEKGTEELSLFNSAYLIDPDGRVKGRYDKVHLVPFGEYVPLRNWLPFLGKMVPQAADFNAGTTGQLLEMNGPRIGVQICYEMIFPELSAAMVRRGGDLIVNITNDAWFGKTAAPYQHFSMGVLRAVENRRAVVRAANTGISGFINPSGRIGETSEIFKTRILVRQVPVIKQPPTFYSRHDSMLPWICMAASLLAVAVSLRKGLRRRWNY
ncbi:MAG: apolipoprotein N-acyltransferase [Desulfobacteraceae bacterium]|nr:apolipoprotein N-acyltransferase [Desulfobacteraceae bacterium]